VKYCHCMYGLSHVAPKKFRKTPSNASNSQKCFVDLIFGHHRCPLSGNFSSLVQIRIEEITNLIYAIIDKKKSIMVSQKNDPKKDDFRTEKVTCDIPQNAYFLFY
jgi:hypothetical protein